VSGLSHVRTTVLGFHIHVNCPDVHAFWVIGNYTFEHSPALLGISTLELKHAKLGNEVNVLILGDSLESSLKHLLCIAEFSFFVLSHIYQKLKVT
jgi:hypothetical protein